jgi:hypothetical protein
MSDRSDYYQALAHFWQMAQRDHGGAGVAAKLLLGLYNSTRFPFPLTELGRLDSANLERALTILRMDAQTMGEVHYHLGLVYSVDDMGMRFEHLAHAWRLKGKCKHEYLDPVPPLPELS